MICGDLMTDLLMHSISQLSLVLPTCGTWVSARLQPLGCRMNSLYVTPIRSPLTRLIALNRHERGFTSHPVKNARNRYRKLRYRLALMHLLIAPGTTT